MSGGTAKPQPKDKEHDGANFAQITWWEDRKAFHTTTKKFHWQKKCHVNDLESNDDFNYSSRSCGSDSTKELLTCKKTKLGDSIKKSIHPSPRKAIQQLK